MIDELRGDVRDWLASRNLAKQRKTLRFETPEEAVASWKGARMDKTEQNLLSRGLGPHLPFKLAIARCIVS